MRKFYVYYKVTMRRELPATTYEPNCVETYHTTIVSIEGKVNRFSIWEKLQERWENYYMPVEIKPLAWSLEEEE